MKANKFLAMLLSLVMVLSLLPASVGWAAIEKPNTSGEDKPGNKFPTVDDNKYSTGDNDFDYRIGDNIPYVDANGNTVTSQLSAVMNSANDNITLSGGWYAVTSDTTINGSISFTGDVNLILADDATLTVNGDIISKTDENTYYDITVFCQQNGTGKLVAKGVQDTQNSSKTLSCADLTIHGGVLEISTSDATNPVGKNAIYATNLTANGGKLTATSGNINAECSYSGASLSWTISVLNSFTLNGGEVTAKSGNTIGGVSFAFNCSFLTVNGGTLIADHNSQNSVIYADLNGKIFNLNGGTVKSLREGEAVSVSACSVNLSSSSIKLDKTCTGCEIFEINISGDVSLDDILADDLYFYYEGKRVQTDGLTKIGEYDSESINEPIYILGENDRIEELYIAVATSTDSNDKKRVININDNISLLYALSDENVETVKFYNDVRISSEEFSEFITNNPVNGSAVFKISSKKLTIDLNGKEVVIEGTPSIPVIVTGNLTIKDTSKAQNGSIGIPTLLVTPYRENCVPSFTFESGNLFSSILYLQQCTATVSGGKLWVGVGAEGGNGVNVDAAKLELTGGLIESGVLVRGGMFEMTGGVVGRGTDSLRLSDEVGVVYGDEGAIFKISGGKIATFCPYSYYNNGKNIFTPNNQYVNITGGEFGRITGDISDATTPEASTLNYPLLALLAPGYAYYDAQNEDVLVNGYCEELNNVVVKPHSCTFKEDEGYEMCNCGRVLIDGNSQTSNSIAKLVITTPDGDVRTDYVSTFNEMTDKIQNGNVTSVTLLKDIKENQSKFFELYCDLELDLNGYTLDLNYTSEEEGEVYTVLKVFPAANLTVKDSSADKKGVLKLGAFELYPLATFKLESGNVICTAPDEGFDNQNNGELVIAGGTFDLGELELRSNSGYITVSGGILKGKNIIHLHKGMIMMADAEEPAIQTDLAKVVKDARETGDNMLISGGEVMVREINVYDKQSLRITGGKVKATPGNLGSGIIFSPGGQVTVSGGEISSLFIDTESYESGFTILKGGKFEEIFHSKDDAAILNLLEEGYAYYDAKTGNVIIPTDDEDYGCTISNVKVQSHTCTFDSTGKCACGRIGKPNVEAVGYIDKNGDEKQVTSYKLINGTETRLTKGWYVVNGNVTLNDTLYISGSDVNIILKDGSTLTANNAIVSDKAGALLTIYGQKAGSGRLSVSGAVAKNGGYETISVDNLTVNGGIIDAIGKNSTDSDKLRSYAIYVDDDFTVNGGVINATGGNINLAAANGNKYLSAGIHSKNNTTVNGGVINTIGGSVSVKGDQNYVWSAGMVSGVIDDIPGYEDEGKLTVNGGVINAIGGYTYAQGAYSTSDSDGLGVENNFVVNNGTINALTGDSKVSGEESSNVLHNGVYVNKEFCMNNGTMNVTVGDTILADKIADESLNGVGSEYITINGGDITVKFKATENKKYTTGFNAKILNMNGGNVLIMDDDLFCDVMVMEECYITGGTIKNAEAGGINLWAEKLAVSGGSFKLRYLSTSRFDINRTCSFKDYLQKGYVYCDNILNVIYPTNYTLENVHVIPEPIDITLDLNDKSRSVEVSLANIAGLPSGDKAYALAEPAPINNLNTQVNKNGVVTVSLKDTAENTGIETAIIQISSNNFFTYVLINANITTKKLPKVTVNGTLEKVYDGTAIYSSEIAKVVTVKDGDDVISGSWHWVASQPLNAFEGKVNARFTPDEEFETQYATIYVAIPVKITKKPITGLPTYNLIEEEGKTLADAGLNANSAWVKGILNWVDEKGNILSATTKVEKNAEYKWKFVPNDSVNYQTLEGSTILFASQEGSVVPPSNDGGSSKKNETTTVKNPDGSTTTVTENKKTGTVTETTKNPDGSTSVTETKKDGTVTTTEKDKTGNTIETVKKPDGDVTVTEKRKDGTTVTTTTDKEGTKSEIKAPDGKNTEIIIPVDNADDVTQIIVTDSDGNKTEVTDFEVTENGIKLNVSGNCTATVIGGAISTNPAKKTFADIIGHWGESSINFMIENGLMNGVSEDEFGPEETLTRGMLVTILYRAMGCPEVNKSVPFGDVSSDSYYANAVIWAAQNGIVSGVDENEFAPEENITREQIAAILYRFAKLNGYDVSVGESTNILSYSDAEEISEYAIEAMQYAVGSGIIKGKTASTLNPKDNATRAELATIVQRFLEINK